MQKDGGVSAAADEAKFKERTAKPIKASTRRLTKTINGFVKETKRIGKMAINESRWFFHVDNFIEDTMQESILDIKLAYAPVPIQGHRKNEADGGWLDNRTQSFIKVNAIFLIV